MEYTIVVVAIAICGYLLYRFGVSFYNKGLTESFEIMIETLNDMEEFTEEFLENQELESYRFYYVKGNDNAVKQIKEMAIDFKDCITKKK